MLDRMVRIGETVVLQRIVFCLPFPQGLCFPQQPVQQVGNDASICCRPQP